MKGHKQLTSSNKDNWETPECVLERVRRVGRIGLDPYSTSKNPTGAGCYFTPESGPLPWTNWGLVYVNPPYSQIRSVSNVITVFAREGAEIVALVPARTDTRWFESLCWNTAQSVCFWRGRIKFNDPETGKPPVYWNKKQKKWVEAAATFPSAVIYFGERTELFRDAFGDVGKVIAL